MPRRGRMSHEERLFIIEQAGKMDPVDIAKRIDRTPEMVKEFIKSKTGVDAKTPSAEFAIRKELRGSAEWDELQKQFDESELRYFEERYATWLAQFKEDILPSEETQVFMLIKNEILMNRNLADKQRAVQDMGHLQKMLDGIYGRYASSEEMEEDDKKLAASINEQLTGTRSAMSVRTKEFLELQAKHNDLMKQLKATRDQRLKRIESSRESFVEILKELLQEEKRLKEGEHMELMRLAALKERARLGELHQYADGMVDRPFLNSETVSD